MNQKVLDAYNQTKAFYCLDCGKCTSNCPVARYQEDFSPRLIVKNATVGFDDDLINDPMLWDCLTCEICSERCRSDVQFADFIRVLRSEAVDANNIGVCSHGGVLQGLMRMMTNQNLNPNRLSWLNDEMKIAKTGEVMLFTGCIPLFQTIFDNFESNSVDILKASIKLMNHAGVKPVVTEQERCCGHDMLWTGEVQTFERLAELNAKTFSELGVKTIVTPCPEGYLTLKKDYPEYLNSKSGNNWDYEVLHITEYLAKLIEEGKLEFPKENPYNDITVTYHDSCRLARFMGITDAPRTLLSAIPGLKLIEMEHNRERSLCCGVSNWTNCTKTSRSIRVERLNEALATGADKLITSCPKCQIHFKCYTNNEYVRPQIKIDIDDIVVFAARAFGLIT
jgi:Fe-S oxidoreductase